MRIFISQVPTIITALSLSLATLPLVASRWSLVRGSHLPSCFSVLEKHGRRRAYEARPKTGGQVWRLQLRLPLGPDRIGGADDEIEARRYRVRPVDGVGPTFV